MKLSFASLTHPLYTKILYICLLYSIHCIHHIIISSYRKLFLRFDAAKKQKGIDPYTFAKQLEDYIGTKNYGTLKSKTHATLPAYEKEMKQLRSVIAEAKQKYVNYCNMQEKGLIMNMNQGYDLNDATTTTTASTTSKIAAAKATTMTTTTNHSKKKKRVKKPKE